MSGGGTEKDVESRVIRKARPEEIPEICELLFREYMESRVYEFGLNYSFRSISTAIATMLDKPGMGEVFVAELSGYKPESVRGELRTKLIGCIIAQYAAHISDLEELQCREVAWYVMPAYRDKRTGELLWKAVTDQAAIRGVRVGILGGKPHNVPLPAKGRVTYSTFFFLTPHEQKGE